MPDFGRSAGGAGSGVLSFKTDTIMSKIVTQEALRSALETLVGHLPATGGSDNSVIEIEGVFASTDDQFKNYLWYEKESEKTNYTSKHAGCYVAYFKDKEALYLVNTNTGSKKINAYWSDREDFVKYPALYTTRQGHGLVQCNEGAGYCLIGYAPAMELIDGADLESDLRLTVSGDSPGSINAAASLGTLRKWLNTDGLVEESNLGWNLKLLLSDKTKGVNKTLLLSKVRDLLGWPTQSATLSATSRMMVTGDSVGMAARYATLGAVEQYIRRQEYFDNISAQDLMTKLTTGKIGTDATLLKFLQSGYNGATLTAVTNNNFQLRLEKVFGYSGHGVRIEGPFDIDDYGQSVTQSQTWHQYMIWFGASSITGTTTPTTKLFKCY